MNNKINLCFVSSKGGHLVNMLQLKPIIRKYRHFWVTFPGKDSSFYLSEEKKYYAHHPESRNVINFVKNSLLAIAILRRERPTHVISAGAGLAVPFFFIGKWFFKCKTIYIENYDFVAYPSLSGKILYNIVDLFIIQHVEQKQWYPKAHFWGSLL